MLEDWGALPCLVIWNRPSFDIHVIPASAGMTLKRSTRNHMELACGVVASLPRESKESLAHEI